ncbi:MAG: hypothetical protein MJY44_06345 [Bacteroidales bacterium]|nr:hypothetical protein [Bacteroidales bacterium]
MRGFRSFALMALSAALFAAAFPSCSKPSAFECFVRSSEVPDGGRYCFDLDLSDSLVAWSVDFYSRMDTPLFLRKSFPVRMDVLWISPTGEEYAESVYADFSGTGGSRLPYRRGVIPPERGLWRLEVEVSPRYGEMNGLGIVCNGTRQAQEVR